MKIAFQGESGAFSDEAARTLFGLCDTCGYADFYGVVKAVESGQADYGMLPCENTIFGSVSTVYDLLLRNDNIAIVDETEHYIVQCLIGAFGSTIDTVERVCSHPVALAQCHEFFVRHSSIKIEPVDDTAGAIRAVVERGDRSVAAIGPRLAGQRYNGVLLAEGIQDDETNITRFFVIGCDRSSRRNLGRICIAFTLPNSAGSLSRVLSRIAECGLNLRTLIMRPAPGRPVERIFCAELDSPHERNTSRLRNAFTVTTRILGCY